MVKILITDATILTLSKNPRVPPLIRRGYIFIKDGRVVAVDEGEPPDEYQYPELLLNGEGRLVIPGMSSGITSVSLYPLRYEGRPLLAELKDYLSILSRTDIYYATMLAMAEMILSGVTTAMISDIYLDSSARAAKDAGIMVTLAPPIGCGLEDFGVEREIELLLSRWHGKVDNVKAAVLTCGDISEDLREKAALKGLRTFSMGREGEVRVNPGTGAEAVIRFGDGLVRWSPGEGVGIWVRPSYSITEVLKEIMWRSGSRNLIDVLASAIDTHSMIGWSSVGAIEPGRVANIVMLDTHEPPGWPVPERLDHVARAVIEGSARVETVIAGEEILVDAGELLTIGEAVLRRSVERFRDVMKELRKKDGVTHPSPVGSPQPSR